MVESAIQTRAFGHIRIIGIILELENRLPGFGETERANQSQPNYPTKLTPHTASSAFGRRYNSEAHVWCTQGGGVGGACPDTTRRAVTHGRVTSHRALRDERRLRVAQGSAPCERQYRWQREKAEASVHYEQSVETWTA